MLWNFSGKPESSVKLDSFTGADEVSSYAERAIAWAIENGIISGRGNGVLDPLGTATRAEAATILMNYIGK